MATKAKKSDEKKRSLNISQLIRDMQGGKVAEPTFKGNLTKYYREKGKEDKWIEKRVRHLVGQGKTK